jgi:hypothetical protein
MGPTLPCSEFALEIVQREPRRTAGIVLLHTARGPAEAKTPWADLLHPYSLAAAIRPLPSPQRRPFAERQPEALPCLMGLLGCQWSKGFRTLAYNWLPINKRMAQLARILSNDLLDD